LLSVPELLCAGLRGDKSVRSTVRIQLVNMLPPTFVNHGLMP
jgi:hypothetical protein